MPSVDQAASRRSAIPAARSPPRLSPMQVHDVLAQPRDHVAYVRSARAFGGQALFERGNLVGKMGQRPAGVGVSGSRRLVVCD